MGMGDFVSENRAMKPKRIQLRRIKGWRKPEGCIVVSRPSKFGNPFDDAESFRHWLINGEIGLSSLIDRNLFPWRPASKSRLDAMRKCILDALPELRGRDLACWCPLVDEDGEHVQCHADVLLELANETEN